jgi:hypothetical protein
MNVTSFIFFIVSVKVTVQLLGVTDIADSLKSGKTLCKLINAISPGAIPRFNTQSLDSMERVFIISHSSDVTQKSTLGEHTVVSKRLCYSWRGECLCHQ